MYEYRKASEHCTKRASFEGERVLGSGKDIATSRLRPGCVDRGEYGFRDDRGVGERAEMVEADELVD